MTTPKLRFKEFNDSWDLKKLDQIAEVNPKTKELPASFFYIDLESVSEGLLIQRKKIDINEAPSRAQRLLEKSDVLFQMVRPYQQNNFYFDLDGDYVASTGYAQIRTKLNSKYIYYVLHSKKFLDEVINRCTGTSYPAINSSELSSIEVAFPSIREQTKIAYFLAAVDEKISQLTQKHQLLSQYKQGMMQKLFSQQIRFKADDGSEFGEWEVVILKDILISYRLGGNYSNSETQTPYPLIKMGNLGRGSINLDKIEYIPSEEKIDVEDLIKTNDLFFNTRNTLDLVGKVAIWRDELPQAYYNSNLMRLKFENNIFMNYLFNERTTLEKLKSIASGTTSVAAIYTKDLLKINLEIPCLEEQTKIANFLSTIDQKIDVASEQLEQAKLWKKGLLQQMFV